MIINRANYESYLLDYLEGNLPAELLVEMEMFLSQNLDIAAQIDNPNLPKIVPEDFPIPDFTNLVKPVNWNVSEVEILLINSIENQLEKSDLKRLAQYKKAFPNKFIELEGVLKNTQLSAPDLALGGSIKEELKMVDFNSNESKLIAYLENDLDSKEYLELDVKTASNPELKKSLELYFSTKLQADIGTRLTKEEKKRLKRKTAGIIIPLWLKSAAVAAAVIFGLFLIPQEAAVDTAYEPREENSFIAEIELEYADIKNGILSKKEENDARASIMEDEVNNNSPSSYAADKQTSASRGTETPPPFEKMQKMPSRSLELASVILELPSDINLENIDVKRRNWEYSDLAEENLQKKNGFSIREFAEHKTKKTIGEEDEENLAVAFVNSGAKKILDTDEDILVYEKGEEKGFKFSLGKFSIESTR